MAELHAGATGSAMPPIGLLDLTARRLTSKAGFMPLYEEGFAILDDAAAFMGDQDLAKNPRLSRAERITFTLETCKLTTAAIRLAAWMMMQRAVVEGEVSVDDLAADPDRPTIDAVELPDMGRVPDGLKTIVLRLERFTERMQFMDRGFYGRLQVC